MFHVCRVAYELDNDNAVYVPPTDNAMRNHPGNSSDSDTWRQEFHSVSTELVTWLVTSEPFHLILRLLGFRFGAERQTGPGRDGNGARPI